MTETFPPILELVPHDGRMSLLDRVIDIGEDDIRCGLTLHAESLFCGVDGVGAWVGIEYMAQTVAAFAGWEAKKRGEAIKPGFLLGTRRYLCHRSWFHPGDALVIEARRELQAPSGLAAFECRITVDGACCAEATLSVYQPESVHEMLDHDKA
jgi:predicted hotdog family 3-hydroxylacyl-ACP dehydratase